MFLQLIETLVIERCHKLGVGRLAVRPLYCETPLLLLTRLQAITERLPNQGEVFVRQRTLNTHLVVIDLALLHPRKGEQHAITIFLFVC